MSEMLRAGWSKFRATAKETVTYWSDQQVGDLDFFNGTLKPVIDRYTMAGESLGEPDGWDDDTIEKGQAFLAEWMEFKYKVAELRTEYLMDKRFSDSE